MELLKEYDLYRKGMIEIRTKTQIDRYNGALESLGIEPTKLKSFSIDGWGWSPEVAIEKEDDFYLSHGLANPYALIITPKQKNVPVYMPYHSFDKYIIQMIFDELEDQIHELTMRTAIVVECDQEISSYRSPEDLLGIEYFTMRFSTVDKLSEAKELQLQMERKFYDEEYAWADTSLRNKLRNSYQEYGVLANKKFLLPDITFMEVDSFYTRAFDGIFLLRKLAGLRQPVLIYEKYSQKGDEIRGQAAHHMEYNLEDPKLKNYLIDKNIIGVYADTIFRQVEDIERLMFLELANVIFKEEPDVDVSALTAPQIRQRVNRYTKAGLLTENYFEFEDVVNKLKKGQIIKLGKLPKPIFNRLIRPNPEFSKRITRIIWRILLKIDPYDVFRLYIYDKEEFFNQYKTWPQAKKQWAVNYIAPRYKNYLDMDKI
ncbi:MAG: hypothetical protein HKN39_07445 [Flavobacteriales bacterium]|nr:hypothetical protein [Flavobacteriales bacterium]